MTDNFLPFALPNVGEDEIEAVVEALRSGWLTTGPKVAEFESAFVQFLGDGELYAVAVNSATAGLHLALEAAGIGVGDEVLVPTWTFTATAEVVRYLGATPVLVDVDPDTLCLDLDAAAEAITGRTRAVMPVHFAGRAMGSRSLEQFCRKYSLIRVDDAAHALPAASEGEVVGAGEATATVFSFYATKTITTGEGGMVVTRSKDIASRMRTMRLHGISRDVFDRYRSKSPSWFYEVVAPGFKYNMTDPAAAMGLVQLSKANSMRDRREAIASRYSADLAGLAVDLPSGPTSSEVHSWHLYVIRLHSSFGLSRDEFIEQMALRGVGCSVHFIPLHKHPVWRELGGYSDDDFPVASGVFDRVFSLPIYPSMTDGDVERVVTAVKDLAS